MSTLTPEQQATYAGYYLMLRDAALNDDPRVAALFDAHANLMDDEEPTAEKFDKLMASVAAALGY